MQRRFDDSMQGLLEGLVGMRRFVGSASMDGKKASAFQDHISRVVPTYIMTDPRAIKQALALIMTARNPERVADHATNVAGEVISLVEGCDVRHRHETKNRAAR
jgi:phosphate transport system protein